MMNRTRHTLIQRLQAKGDEAAWEDFVKSYQPYIYTVLRRMGIDHEEADDLQQDILVKLWKKLPEFNYQPDKAKFRTWLCQVIRNTAVNTIRSKISEQERIHKYQQELACSEDQIDSLMEIEWKTYITNKAMDRVKDKFSTQSIKIFEKMLQGISVELLAQEFSVKENSIYRIKNRVKERLILEIAQLRRDLE